jgi:hypothetical protein
MPLKAKHVVEEIDGVRCTVVEKGATAARVEFLKSLLEFNGLEVKTAEEKPATEDAPVTYSIGVTDLVFHPVIAIYEFKLKTPSGKLVSPAYWDQKEETPVDQYWLTDEEKKPGGSAWFYAE